MIILYQVPLDAKGAAVRSRLKAQGRVWVEATAGEAGRSLRELFEGKTSARAYDEKVPHKPGIFFQTGEITPDEVAALLDAFAADGVFFTYPVLVDEASLDMPLGALLLKEHGRKAFLSRVVYLQQLIDSTDKLKAVNYDEDRWSDLRIAVANANDFIDAMVRGSEDPDARPVEAAELDRVTRGLQQALNDLLNCPGTPWRK